MSEIEVGQHWHAVRYTAEDVDHLDYTVTAVEGGTVTLRRDDGRVTTLDSKMLPIYADLVRTE